MVWGEAGWVTVGWNMFYFIHPTLLNPRPTAYRCHPHIPSSMFFYVLFRYDAEHTSVEILDGRGPVTYVNDGVCYHLTYYLRSSTQLSFPSSRSRLNF